MELDQNPDYFTSDLPDRVEDSYLDNRGAFNDFIYSLEENSAVEKGPESTSGINIEALLKLTFAQSLPQIDIRKFAGKYSEWGNFKDLFRGMIHKREDLTPVMKLYHLKALLTGEALDDNYLEAWDTLVRYYENGRRLVDCYLDEFANVEAMRADSSAEMKRLSKKSLVR